VQAGAPQDSCDSGEPPFCSRPGAVQSSTSRQTRRWHGHTSSAAALFDDFHIDGIRVDLTDAIHNNNVLHWNGTLVGNANLFGAKLLRELTRTVLTLKSSAFLIAEDYTGWPAMTQPVNQGGIGFDAIWYMDFYHNLIGDGNYGDSYANLLKNAGLGVPDPLNMDYFAGALLATQYDKVAYHESHDEAGNDPGTERTIVTAVNSAPLFGATRTYADRRRREEDLHPETYAVFHASKIDGGVVPPPTNPRRLRSWASAGTRDRCSGNPRQPLSLERAAGALP
jgi:hypothetical protein